MSVARQRQPADNHAIGSLRDVHRGVRILPHRFEIATLVSDAAPLPVCRDQPRFRFRAYFFGKTRQRFRVRGIRWTDDEVATHATTTPDPPRLGSPAAANSSPGNTS